MNYRSYADLVAAVGVLAAKLSEGGPYSCVIGIPRSGMIPATMLALRWNVPCYTVSEYLDRTKSDRGYSKRQVMCDGIPLLVDDSVRTGSRIQTALKDLKSVISEVTVACIYANEESSKYVNFFAETVEDPRVFEWNLFHHDPFLQFCGIDIDGVLCPDPPKEVDEVNDEASYIRWIMGAPVIRPSTVLMGTLVTSRLEKFRELTEAWLRENGFDYIDLIMSSAPDARTRRAQKTHATDKIKAYREHPQWKMFIESSVWQSELIFAATDRPVLCTDTGHFY